MTKLHTDSTAVERIKSARERLLSEYIRYLDGIDERDPAAWATIVTNAREAGLDKDTLCRELSCAWSTVLRWEAGQTVPGSFTRSAIKARLLQMLEHLRVQQRSLVAAE